MDTISLNSQNSKTSNLHRLLLNLTDKIDIPIGEKSFASSNPSNYSTIIYLKYQLLPRIMNLK